MDRKDPTGSAPPSQLKIAQNLVPEKSFAVAAPVFRPRGDRAASLPPAIRSSSQAAGSASQASSGPGAQQLPCVDVLSLLAKESDLHRISLLWLHSVILVNISGRAYLLLARELCKMFPAFCSSVRCVEALPRNLHQQSILTSSHSTVAERPSRPFDVAGWFCAADVTRVGSSAVLDGAARSASFERECSCENMSTDQARSGTHPGRFCCGRTIFCPRPQPCGTFRRPNRMSIVCIYGCI